ncbi:MAG: hypothetical protein QM691_16670 [Opitutaceae bacterium]
MPLTPEQFELAWPRVTRWITQLLADRLKDARQVGELGFRRRPRYFSRELLTAKAVLVDRVPVPPLTALGVPGFGDFESMQAAGITYLDTFFVDRRYAADESLHFHEMIHVVQWQMLGPKGFIAAYADGLARFGYRDSPLEVMAYDLQARFETESAPFAAERLVRESLTP